MVKAAGPVPDGTPQYDDAGLCVFCGGRDEHVHPEPRPKKTKRATGPAATDDEGED